MLLQRGINLGKPVADHPLTRGLVHWWRPLPHNSRGAVLYDIAGVKHASRTGSPGWSVAQLGNGPVDAVTGFGLNTYYSFSNVTFSSDYTVVIFLNYSSLPSASYAIAGDTCKLGLGATTYANIRVRDAAGQVYPSISGVNLNSWQQFAVSVKTSVNSYCFMDYTKSASFAGSSGNATFNRIGCDNSTSPVLGSIASVQLYNRALEDAEIFQLRAEAVMGYPSLLRRTSRRFLLGSTAGGGGGFQPAWARGSNVILGSGS